jgi:hypothetical protein
VGDTSNWEFAAVVAAVCIGMGGLLLITLIAAAGAWRVFARASEAAEQAARAADAVEELARRLTASAQHSGGGDMADLRARADALLEQQARLQEAARNLLESGVLRSEQETERLRALDEALSRIEQQLERIARPADWA